MNRCRATLRSFLALASVLVVSFYPAVADTPDRPASRGDDAAPLAKKITSIEGITEYRLDNGVRFLLFPDSSTPKITVNCTVFVGSRHEGYGETGMAHLLEHMLLKGCKLYPKPTDIPKALRDRGAFSDPHTNASTSYDRTNYYETLNATDDNLEFAIRLEADRLVNSFVRREDLASEMTVVRNEFEQCENKPQYILFQRMLATAYEWHNYGKTTIGNRSDIERVPIEKLQAFYRKFYQPDNILLIVTGNFKEEKARALIRKYFGALKKPERSLDTTYTEEPAQDGERSVVLRRVGTVGMVGAIYHIPAVSQADFAALDVLEQVLGSEPSGRLYKELVERSKKLTNLDVGAYGLHDPGVFIVLGSVGDKTSIESAREALLQAIDKARASEISEEEVQRAKAHFKNVWKTSMSHSDRVAGDLSEWAARGDWRLMFLHRDRVYKVTPADVRRVAQKYLTTTNRTVGLYVPTKAAERAAIPASPDIAELLKGYKSNEAVSAGESFEPTVENIAKRVQLSQLSSGVKVALLPRKARGERVTIDLVLHYGNADSLKGHTSASQFLGTMMVRGTKKRSRQELVDEFNRLEARINGGGLIGDAVFSISCKRETLPKVLPLLAEILREPTFPENEFNVLKRQLREHLEEGKTQPGSRAGRALRRKMSSYPPEDVRYTPTIEESLERLANVTLEEVRKLYDEQLGGQHGELVVVGDFDPAAVVKQMDQALKGWKAAVPYRRIERPLHGKVEPARVVIETPDKESAVYYAATRMALKDTDPDYAALVMADYLLGGGPLSSRLANRIRQKAGLSYTVMSHFQADALDKSAVFFIGATCKPDKIDNLHKLVQEEVNKMLKEGITETELSEGKKAYLASLKQRRGDDSNLADILQSELEAGRTIAYYAELEKKIAALTVEEVNSAFRRRIDPKKLVIIQAGDFKKK
ncbi:MAG TPA: pitrilysin family protein [Gemmataceae bacterium]|nr:pitrilysin family protein [Gemmataceae bacterium]